MRHIGSLSLALLACALPAGAGELEEPFFVEVEGEPLDIGGVGHSAPFFADLNGDGREDLLVGEFRGGTLRIYPDVGEGSQRAFAGFELLKAGSDVARVPTG